jgi:hypothetical protein
LIPQIPSGTNLNGSPRQHSPPKIPLRIPADPHPPSQLLSPQPQFAKASQLLPLPSQMAATSHAGVLSQQADDDFASLAEAIGAGAWAAGAAPSW